MKIGKKQIMKAISKLKIRNKALTVGLTVLLGASLLTGCAPTRDVLPGAPKTEKKVANQTNKQRQTMKVSANGQGKLTAKQAAFLKPWPYTSKRKFAMLTLDWHNRALGSHIQLKRSQLPQAKRAPRIYVNPSGWHNYKLKTTKNGRNYVTWMFNRGHLVGYQFCGINDEPRNLVTETTYLNQGSLTGMDDSNQNAMLFYENGLRQWLESHPQNKLDYAVVPLYHRDELVPRQVMLSFVGIKPSNKQVKIKLPGARLTTAGKVTQVVLDNASPHMQIDYANGYAKITK